MIRKIKNKQQNDFFIKANHNIRCPEVRVLTDRGEMVGIMTTSEALEKARYEEKDLVLVTEGANPPIAKIIELSKYKYQLKQKKAEGRKKAKNQELKEVRFTQFMADQDFETRYKSVERFIKKGHKVKISLQFARGRAITKKEFGFEVVEKILTRSVDIAEVEIPPKTLGRKIIAQLMPTTKKSKKDA